MTGKKIIPPSVGLDEVFAVDLPKGHYLLRRELFQEGLQQGGLAIHVPVSLVSVPGLAGRIDQTPEGIFGHS